MQLHNASLKSAFCALLVMPSKNTPAVADESLSYEAALQELESLVARMESGQMPLDELLSAYTRGSQLLKQCRDKLIAVEQQIRQIDAQADGGTGVDLAGGSAKKNQNESDA
jgi:exodeoxyribonuclease VII small subunit